MIFDLYYSSKFSCISWDDPSTSYSDTIYIKLTQSELLNFINNEEQSQTKLENKTVASTNLTFYFYSSKRISGFERI